MRSQIVSRHVPKPIKILSIGIEYWVLSRCWRYCIIGVDGVGIDSLERPISVGIDSIGIDRLVLVLSRIGCSIEVSVLTCTLLNLRYAFYSIRYYDN